jgi:hypothetical protein
VESFVDWWGAKPFTEIQNGADNFSSFRNVQSTASQMLDRRLEGSLADLGARHRRI